jgi:hypothetical protein
MSGLAAHRGVHRARVDHRDHLDAERRRERHWTLDQRHLGAAQPGRAGDGVAHPARRAVADEAHRIERLVGRPGGDHERAAGEVLRREDEAGRLDDVGRLGQPPGPGPAAGEEAVARPDHLRPDGVDQAADVRLGERVAPHVDVHRRGEQERRPGREEDGGHRVVRHAGGHAGEEVGRGGGDDHQIGAIGHPDVPDLGLLTQVEEVGQDRASRQGLEGQLADELAGRGGHHDLDLGARLDQEADQLGRLVRRDAPADGEDHASSGEGIGQRHRARIAPPERRRKVRPSIVGGGGMRDAIYRECRTRTRPSASSSSR